MRSLTGIEEQDTQKHVEQVLSALSQEVLDLEYITVDWAAWDDTYAFIEDANSEYIESNLTDETFPTLRLNLMLFVHSSGRIVFGKAFDLDSEEEIPISPSLLGHLSSNGLLVGRPGTDGIASGLILLDEGPMLVVPQPILTSGNEGPARGTLIFGRYLGSTELDRLAQLTLATLTIHRLDDVMPHDIREALPSLLGEAQILVQPLSTQHIAGYTLISDIYGKPVLTLKVDIPRDIYQLGQRSVVYYVLVVLAIGVLATGAVILIMQKQVLSRFTVLIRSVNNIASTGDTSERVTIEGGDELALVAGTINGMLASLQESELEVRESEARYRALLELGGEVGEAVVMMQDTEQGEGIQTFVSDEWPSITGYTREELLGMSFFDLVHPEYREASLKRHQGKMRGEAIPGLFEMTIIKKDGAEVPVELTSAYTTYRTQRANVAYIRDITERKEAQERLQQFYEQERKLRQDLEREIEKRVEYTRALVHELKTPITPVLAASELLLEEVKEGPLRGLVQSIDRSASNLNRRIDELLDLARGEVGQLELNYESVDPLPLLVGIVHEMIPVALSNRQTLTQELPSFLPTAWADRDRLRQIVYNLINNAFKFTPAEGKITLRAREDGANLVVEVEDTGRGISKQEQQRLFEPYHRVESDRERLSGLGLGLVLTKRFVELHGGKIWVKSKKGKGSTFGFSVPLEATSQKAERIKKGGKA